MIGAAGVCAPSRPFSFFNPGQKVAPCLKPHPSLKSKNAAASLDRTRLALSQSMTAKIF
jgi:hypothetical protein